MGRWLAAFVLLLAAGGGLSIYMSWIRIPPNWLPWGYVELEEDPSTFARFQLNGLSADRGICLDTLSRSKLVYQSLDDTSPAPGCGLKNAVAIERSHVPYSRGFRSTCALMAALYWYEQRLDRIAQEELNSRLVRIDHLGTYSCRNIAGRKDSRRSEHATANAIDVAGFALEDGRTISVLKDWGKDTPSGQFLKSAHKEACKLFNVVLGPAYNAAHANHFHFDLGRARLCR